MRIPLLLFVAVLLAGCAASGAGTTQPDNPYLQERTFTADRHTVYRAAIEEARVQGWGLRARDRLRHGGHEFIAVALGSADVWEEEVSVTVAAVDAGTRVLVRRSVRGAPDRPDVGRYLDALAVRLGEAGSTRTPSPETSGSGRTYVIVHGAWGGSWAFRRVDSLLAAHGHRVYRPSLTGLGERVHLASSDVNLSTHIMDVVNVLLFEELEDVVLVGHSYGGMVISGVADQMPERIARLVYLDAFVPEHGESVLSLAGEERRANFEELARDGLVVAPWVSPGEEPPHDVPHPLATLTEPITLENEAARRLPATYILTIEAGATEDEFSPYADRARARGWSVEVMEADHNPQRSAPEELARRLLAVP